MKKKVSKKAVEKITEATATNHPVLYMVFINLAGCHEKVYKLIYKEDFLCPMWSSNSGDECICIDDNKFLGWNTKEWGVAEYITPNKEEAENILKGIQTYIEMLKARL